MRKSPPPPPAQVTPVTATAYAGRSHRVGASYRLVLCESGGAPKNRKEGKKPRAEGPRARTRMPTRRVWIRRRVVIHRQPCLPTPGCKHQGSAARRPGSKGRCESGRVRELSSPVEFDMALVYKKSAGLLFGGSRYSYATCRDIARGDKGQGGVVVSIGCCTISCVCM